MIYATGQWEMSTHTSGAHAVGISSWWVEEKEISRLEEPQSHVVHMVQEERLNWGWIAAGWLSSV